MTTSRYDIEMSNFKLNYANYEFVRTFLLVCDLRSFGLLITKTCPSVQIALLRVSALKAIKKTGNCTWEWNQKMLSAAKQRKRKSGFAGEHERELARDQRNESALTEKAAEDTFLYFYQPKSAKG